MFERQRKSGLILKPLGWRAWLIFSLVLVSLIQVIIGLLHHKAFGTWPDADLLYIANFFSNTVSEFGMPVVLFGLSFCSFLIGLRMVIYPITKRTEHRTVGEAKVIQV